MKNIINVLEKVCTKCKILKSYDDFYKRKRNTESICKECRNIQHKQYYQDNKEKVLQQQKQCRKNNKEQINTWYRQYYLNNKEKILKRHRQWHKNNKEQINARHRQHYQDNKERHLQQYQDNKEAINKRNNQWCQNNRDQINEYRRNKKKNDIQYRLACNLRSRLWHIIKNGQKAGSAVQDLGCSVDEFKLYLENLFQPDMSWVNYGKYGWHLDHVKPLVFFDLTNREQFLEACNYKNLQPLWAKENLSKGSK